MPKSLDELAADGLIDPGWAHALAPVAPRIAELGDFLRAETAAGRGYLPSGDRVLRAFGAPMDDVRVLIVGQDPYPTPGHPIGLSFAVDPHVRPVPRSLANIYRELADDLGVATPAHGDLTSWSAHGVMLLNRVLTVRPGAPASHRGKGWEDVTDHAIRTLRRARHPARRDPLGARRAGPASRSSATRPSSSRCIRARCPRVAGFFGSRPFSRANATARGAGRRARRLAAARLTLPRHPVAMSAG